MISTNELKNGNVIEYDGQLCQIIEFQHVLQNKVSYVRVKMKNLRTGTTTETALKGSESKVKLCFIDRTDMQYLYNSGDTYTFMDTETYEQIELPETQIKWEKNFLLEGQMVKIVSYESEVLTVNIPDKVELVITETSPAIKGDATGRKKATLETGYELNVPVFLSEGEKIVVSTIDGTYVSRA